MADIEPIHPDIDWSPQAAAADALNRVPDKVSFIALWIQENGKVNYSKTNLSAQDLGLLNAWIIKYISTLEYD